MKNPEPPEINPKKIKRIPSNDHTKTENDADHSGSDCDNDKTETHPENKSKFDKPKREVDPDTTGIDTNSDKTKK